MDLSRLARQYESSEEISESDFANVIADFGSLQAKVAHGRESGSAEALLAEAMIIDDDLSDWAERCPTKKTWQRVPVIKPSTDVFSNHWDLYPNLGVAFAWNHYRTVRILLNEIICEQLICLIERMPNSPLRAPLVDQISQSKRIISLLAKEICASIPFFLGRRYDGDHSGYDRIFQPQNAVRGRIILWPLYVAASTVDLSDLMRLWIIARLERVANVMEYHKAMMLAHTLKTQHKGGWLGTKDIRGWYDLVAQE